MTGERAYLDYNASAPLRPEVSETMIAVMSRHGNASSVHQEGRAMKAELEKARSLVAGLVGADTEGVVFTSGATEAAQLALTPDISSGGTKRPASKLYVLATEHPCILAGGRFSADQIVEIPVLSSGLVDMEAFDQALKNHNEEDGVPYLAVQLANSETGVIQPVAELAQKVRFKGGYVLCDAVQGPGRISIDIKELGVDFLLISAHKFGGPQGIGALICAHTMLEIPPAITGGGQEKYRRAGTENVAAVAGFGKAAEIAAQKLDQMSHISSLRDSIADRLHPICASNGLGAERICIFGQETERLGNTLLFSVEGLKAETALIAFDLDGVAVSSGSACSSGKVGRSHVLQAMGVGEDQARGAIRVSLGWNSTSNDVEKFCFAFDRITQRLGEMLKEEVSGAA